MALVLFTVLLAAGLIMIPFGMPGTWLMIASAIGFDILVPGSRIGWGVIAGVTALALLAELGELAVVGRYTRRYGGSRRSGWGAIIGGVVGAIVGVPVPLVGSLVGAFVGAFLGALVAESTAGSTPGTATRVAIGAVLGRAVAAGLKVATGLAIGIWLFAVAWR